MNPERQLADIYAVAARQEAFVLAGTHYVPTSGLTADEQEIAALRWEVTGSRAALARISRLIEGDRNGIVSKGEIRDAL